MEQWNVGRRDAYHLRTWPTKAFHTCSSALVPYQLCTWKHLKMAQPLSARALHDFMEDGHPSGLFTCPVSLYKQEIYFYAVLAIIYFRVYSSGNSPILPNTDTFFSQKSTPNLLKSFQLQLTSWVLLSRSINHLWISSVIYLEAQLHRVAWLWINIYKWEPVPLRLFT